MKSSAFEQLARAVCEEESAIAVEPAFCFEEREEEKA
jgi:hypothetical protein